MAEKRTKLQDAIRASVRDKNKVGEGEDVRENTFVDSKTNRVVPDTERNRKRYGEDRVKATTAKGVEKKAMGGRVNLKGGGCAKRGVKKNAYGKNS
jgi:hypothetical protein